MRFFERGHLQIYSTGPGAVNSTTPREVLRYLVAAMLAAARVSKQQTAHLRSPRRLVPVHLAAFHDEHHAAHGGDVFERVAISGNHHCSRPSPLPLNVRSVRRILLVKPGGDVV